ncbi:MAG: choice-of-anchor J domain-containing protein, partial [Muribaculaceae bacterium]|nr:choice-of-anchor J domain-containing protein [Muribaculaceae bacterium]
CIPVKLVPGEIRNTLNLAAHPENFHHEIILCGSHEKFFGTNGLKAVTSYQWVGEAPEAPVVTPPTEAEVGSKTNPLTVTQYLALGIPASPVANTWLTGYIVGSVTDKSLDTAEMGASSASSATNILIAATANPASVSECIPVQLPQGDVRAALNLKDNAGNVGKTVVLCGTRDAYFGVLGMKSVTEYTLDGSTVTPVLPDGTFYKGLSSNADDWTLDEGTFDKALTYVWSWDNKYSYLKASAFVKQCFAADVYAISPVIDLTNAKTANLKLSQAVNKGNGVEGLSIDVREGNGAWQTLTVEGWPAGDSWTFVESSANLDAYAGKKIQIGFHYTSTSSVSSNWEIKDLTVAGESTADGVETIAADAAVYAVNGNIVAPAGARVFNLQGVETGTQSLPAGIYVVVVADKAVKVLVK